MAQELQTVHSAVHIFKLYAYRDTAQISVSPSVVSAVL